MKIVRQIVFDGIGGLKNVENTSIQQLKLDGSQYHLHIFKGKAYALTSKRISTKTNSLNEKIDHFPLMKKIKFPFSKETIFVGEVCAEHLKKDFENEKIIGSDGESIGWNKRCNFVAGIMNSGIDTLENRFPEGNPLKYVIFDILMLNGEDVSGLPYVDKIKILKKHFPSAGAFAGEMKKNGAIIYRIQDVPTDYIGLFNEEVIRGCTTSYFKDCIELGFEGVIFKDVNSNKSGKVKRFLECDCIVIGYTKGNGKYAKNNWIGAIEIGVLTETIGVTTSNQSYLNRVKLKALMQNGVIQDVGRISGFDEKLREKISANKNEYLGSIVNVEYMEWTGKKMRHPRIGEKGFREDQRIGRCTINQF